MTAEQWRRVKQVFEDARKLDAARQQDLLHELSISDPGIVDDLRALLTAYRHSDSFLTTGVLVNAAQADLVDAGLTLIGSRLGAYRVGPLLGLGGMGEVYQGDRADGEFTQRVAIKVVRSTTDAGSVARFCTERQILAGLSHPNIARLYDGGTTEAGEPYFVMEHIEGQSVDRFCKTNGPDLGQRLRLFQTICAAVHYAHQRGVIHGDIKPANIIVGDDGSPHLVDFGVARLIGAPAADAGGTPQARECTPGYASPEQLRNAPLTPVSDVYSLGVVRDFERHSFSAGNWKVSTPARPRQDCRQSDSD